MPSAIQKLIQGVKTETRANPFDAYAAMFEIALGHPDQVRALLEAVMAEWPRGGTFAADAISYLPEADFSPLVGTALAIMKGNGQADAAQDFLAHCSLQCPRALHPHLDAILSLRPNGDTYYCAWPWRESDGLQVAKLREVLQQKDSTDNDRDLAREALFETREPDAMQLARASLNDFTGPPPDYETGLDLLGVGYECRSGKFRRLYSEHAWHLIFDLNYLGANQQPLHLRKQHPTWHSEDASAVTLRFGGHGKHLCAVCGGQSHHLLTLDPVPPSLGVKKMKRLVLETCLSCLGWEEGRLFYRHDANGEPSPTAFKGEQVKPQFPATPFVETKVRLAATPRRWFWQDWALSNSRQNLYRVGGHPCWIQGPDYFGCPDCGQLMQFLLQLDSDLPTATTKEFLWGSGGLGYGCWCDSCRISGFQYQCT